MRSSILYSFSSIARTFTRPKTTINSKIPSNHTRSMSSGIPSETAQAQKSADSSAPSTSDLGIENTNIKTKPGVELSSQQNVLVGSVLDLFAGRPSLKKLQLWKDDATFADPITKAEGRKQYEAQWYGLQTAFSQIERLDYSVKSSGNPITMDIKTRYVIKGINKEQTIQSVVNIHTDAAGEKITMVEDKWNGELPGGAFTKASWSQILSFWWWIHYAEAWLFWIWSFVWWTWPWEVLRNMNSVIVPAFVSVPKNEEEDAKNGN